MSKFIEKTFCKAYGHENITTDTRNILQYWQLHEIQFVKAKAVLGASNYTQSSVVARNKEGRQTGLARRQHYQQDSSHISRWDVLKHPKASVRPKGDKIIHQLLHSRSKEWQPRCRNCSQRGRIAKECQAIKQKNTGSTRQKSNFYEQKVSKAPVLKTH